MTEQTPSLGHLSHNHIQKNPFQSSFEEDNTYYLSELVEKSERSINYITNRSKQKEDILKFKNLKPFRYSNEDSEYRSSSFIHWMPPPRACLFLRTILDCSCNNKLQDIIKPSYPSGLNSFHQCLHIWVWATSHSLRWSHMFKRPFMAYNIAPFQGIVCFCRC